MGRVTRGPAVAPEVQARVGSAGIADGSIAAVDLAPRAVGALQIGLEALTLLGAPNAGPVPVSLHEAISTAAANMGNIGTTQAWVLNYFPPSRIRQNCTVTSFAMRLAAKPAGLGTVYFCVWRKYGPEDNTTAYGYNLIHKVDITAQITAATANTTVTFTTGNLACLHGDYVGLTWTWTGAPANWLTGRTPGAGDANAHYTLADVDPTELLYPWETSGTAVATYYIPILCYAATAPDLIGIGDSTTQGYPGYSLIGGDGAVGADDVRDQRRCLMRQVARRLGPGVTFHNMGWGGDTTTGAAARFAADVIASTPKWVVFGLGINEMASTSFTVAQQATARATALANMTTMLNATVAAGARPVVFPITPRNDSGVGNVLIRNRSYETYNMALQALMAGYPTAIWVDPRPYLGMPLAANLLTTPDFDATSWTKTGDIALSTGAATYTHSSGAGSVTQASATLQEVLVAGRNYRLTYTVSGVSAGCAAKIPTSDGPATADVALVLTNGTARTVQFTAKATPGDFVISATSTAGAFALHDLILEWVDEPTNLWQPIPAAYSDVATGTVGVSGSDSLHPKGLGNDRLAQAIADAMQTVSIAGRVRAGTLQTDGSIIIGGGRGAHLILAERCDKPGDMGNDLRIRAGDVGVQAVNQPGGDLVLESGASAGTGVGSKVRIRGVATGTVAGEAFSEPVDMLVVGAGVIATTGQIVGASLVSPGNIMTLTVTGDASGIYPVLRVRKRNTTGNGSTNGGSYIQFGTPDGAANDDQAGHVGARFNVATSGAEIGEILLSPDRYSANVINAARALAVRADATDGVVHAFVTVTGDLGIGDPAVDGSWRIVLNGANLEIQKKVTGSWVAKSVVTG